MKPDQLPNYCIYCYTDGTITHIMTMWQMNERCRLSECGVYYYDVPWGGDAYNNSGSYIPEQAVSDGGIVTANGSGVLEFTKGLLLLIENNNPERVGMYCQFNKQGYCSLFSN